MFILLIIIFLSCALVEIIKSKWAKECGYNCNKCKVWDCPGKQCIKKSKYFIIPIILISLFTLNVNADTFTPSYFSIGGVESFPQGMWANGGNTNRILTVNAAKDSDGGMIEISKQNFIVLTACVTGNSNSNWITNSGTDSSIQNGPVDTLNTGVSCSAGSSSEFQGTFYKFYFKIYHWGVPSGGADVLQVSSFWNIGNPTEWAVYYWFYSIFITDTSTYLDDAMLVSSGKGQDTIINQNNTIISKTDEINNNITSDDSDVTSSKCGIICKLKGIINGIANLPSKFGDLLKSLFIPTDEQMSDLLNDTQTKLNSKLGILGLPTTLYTQFLNLLTSDVNENSCIEFEDIKDPVYDQVLITSSSYCFNSLLENEKLNSFRTACMLIVGGLIILAFCSYLKKSYNRIMDIADFDENYEYITSEDSYNIDYSTGEVKSMRHNERRTRREKV